MCKGFATKLGAKTNLMSLFKKLVLKIYVSESTPCFVSCGRKIVVIFNRSELNCKQILLCRSTTHNETNMIWWASGSAKTLHFLYQERQKCTFILDSCFRHRIEVGFICRATTLCYHHKTILVTFCCLYIYLRRKVTFRVNFVIHVQRCILRVTQIVFSERVIHTF